MCGAETQPAEANICSPRTTPRHATLSQNPARVRAAAGWGRGVKNGAPCVGEPATQLLLGSGYLCDFASTLKSEIHSCSSPVSHEVPQGRSQRGSLSVTEAPCSVLVSLAKEPPRGRKAKSKLGCSVS